jgi:hypothetical protein
MGEMYLDTVQFNILSGTPTSAGASRFYIEAGGNVGIGTTGPNFKLEVVGDSTSGILAVRNAANARDTFRSENAAGTRTFNIGNDASGHGIILIRNSGGTTTNYITGSGNSYFNGGNVGIGTTSPSGELHVKNVAELYTSLAGSDSAINFVDSQADVWRVGIRASDNSFRFCQSSTSLGTNPRVTIATGGNVGIGTTSPDRNLHVRGSSAIARIESTASSQNSQLDMKSTTATWSVGQNISLANTGTLEFYNGSSSPFVIKTDGNVGIGTTAPSRKFEIHENTTNLTIGEKNGYAPSVYGPVIETNANAITLPRDLYLAGSQANVRNISSVLTLNGDNGIAFRYYDGSAGQEGMRLTNAGKVGIGTTSPQAKLQVSGGIQMADDTDTASAAKVGTMRYRTATNEPVAVTGIELVTNGNFATASSWTKSSNVTISGGQATFTANSAAQYIIQGSLWAANSLSGQKVQLTYTIVSNSLNAGDFRIGGYTGASAFTLQGLPATVGTHSVTLDVRTSGGDDNAIDIYITSSATSGALVIDNLSLIHVTEEDASYADMCMQTAASTYEWVNIVRNSY